MAIVVKFDRDENTLTETADGFTAVRVAVITGLEDVAPASRILWVARQALGTGSVGAAHPSISGMKLQTISMRHHGHNAAIATVTYGHPDAPEDPPDEGGDALEISVGAAGVQETSNTDVDGIPVAVLFTDPDDNETTQTGTFSVFVPNVTLTARRTLPENPIVIARQFVGKVNSGGWSLDPDAFRRDWLCTSITGTSSDRGLTYATTYTFQWKPEFRRADNGTLLSAWDVLVSAIDPETGRPPPDLGSPSPAQGAITNLAYRSVQVYKEADFNLLNLTVTP